MVAFENVFHVKHVCDGEHRVMGRKVTSTGMFDYVVETYPHPDGGVIIRRVTTER